MIVRIGEKIPLIHVHKGSAGIKIERSIGVTRGHNVNLYFFHSKWYSSKRKQLMIVRIGQKITYVHVHMGSEGIKIQRLIGVTRGH